jgi:AcrR family transcriptional regulator
MPPPAKPQDLFMQELRDLLLSEGIRDLGMGEMAKRLKCSRRRLYEIAPTKEELFLKVADETLAAIREAGWRAAAMYETPPQKIEAFFAYGTLIVSKMSPKFLRDLDSLEAGKRMFDEHQRERIRGLEQFIAEGVKQKYFAPCHPRFTAALSFLIVRQIRDTKFQSVTGVTFEEGLREFYELLLYGLVGRQRPRPKGTGAVAPRSTAAKKVPASRMSP